MDGSALVLSREAHPARVNACVVFMSTKGCHELASAVGGLGAAYRISGQTDHNVGPVLHDHMQIHPIKKRI